MDGLEFYSELEVNLDLQELVIKGLDTLSPEEITQQMSTLVNNIESIKKDLRGDRDYLKGQEGLDD
jgi:hypothetical protein